MEELKKDPEYWTNSRILLKMADRNNSFINYLVAEESESRQLYTLYYVTPPSDGYEYYLRTNDLKQVLQKLSEEISRLIKADTEMSLRFLIAEKDIFKFFQKKFIIENLNSEKEPDSEHFKRDKVFEFVVSKKSKKCCLIL